MMCTIYRVHPTGVGMIRYGWGNHQNVRSSSHRRGNDSQWETEEFFIQLFIPQAWEWFDKWSGNMFSFYVHPTGVGMIRIVFSISSVAIGSSHRRGNDSYDDFDVVFKNSFIPQAWEWFEEYQAPDLNDLVHPTGVGMIRKGWPHKCLCTGSSHRRGNDSKPGSTEEFLF